MNIRLASDADVPAIVELLRVSLGEALMPKSQAYWQWKHELNPFGKSPVLVAEDGTNVIAVRAFMRWKWKNSETVYSALRAVDTATHPSHMGKGIFTKLTLKLVDQCKSDGDDFIFNTPNEKSRPGYLKMGWQSAGNFRVRMFPRLRTQRNADYDPLTLHPVRDVLAQPGLNDFLGSQVSRTTTTQYSAAYLSWRYDQVPVATYGAVGNFTGAEKFLVIFRIKDTRWYRELRMVESFQSATVAGPLLRNAVRDVLDKVKPHVISCSAASPFKHLFPSLRVNGPILTTRTLNRPAPLENWSPSIGDLELF